MDGTNHIKMDRPASGAPATDSREVTQTEASIACIPQHQHNDCTAISDVTFRKGKKRWYFEDTPEYDLIYTHQWVEMLKSADGLLATYEWDEVMRLTRLLPAIVTSIHALLEVVFIGSYGIKDEFFSREGVKRAVSFAEAVMDEVNQKGWCDEEAQADPSSIDLVTLE